MKDFILTTYTIVDLILVGQWRNLDSRCLRTCHLSDEVTQNEYFKCLQDRNKYRFWKLQQDGVFLGFGGLSSISWENSNAEISIIMNPEFRTKRWGTLFVGEILHQAFEYLNLKTVYGEVYDCNPAKDFWVKLADNYAAHTTKLKNRKYWNGYYYDSMYFSFIKPQTERC